MRPIGSCRKVLFSVSLPCLARDTKHKCAFFECLDFCLIFTQETIKKTESQDVYLWNSVRRVPSYPTSLGAQNHDIESYWRAAKANPEALAGARDSSNRCKELRRANYRTSILYGTDPIRDTTSMNETLKGVGAKETADMVGTMLSYQY